MQKSLKNDWNPGTWVLIWDYSARAIQWIPTLQGLGGYEKSLCPCALEESSLSIEGVTNHIVIPHVKFVSRDWLKKVGHSIMSTGEMSTGKKSTILTGSTGSHCCFHWYFTKLGFVRFNKTNMPCQCGYPVGMSPLGRMVFPRAPPSGKPSSLWETFHQNTHTGMAFLYNVHLIAMNGHPFYSLPKTKKVGIPLCSNDEGSTVA